MNLTGKNCSIDPRCNIPNSIFPHVGVNFCCRCSFIEYFVIIVCLALNNLVVFQLRDAVISRRASEWSFLTTWYLPIIEWPHADCNTYSFTALCRINIVIHVKQNSKKIDLDWPVERFKDCRQSWSLRQWLLYWDIRIKMDWHRDEETRRGEVKWGGSDEYFSASWNINGSLFSFCFTVFYGVGPPVTIDRCPWGAASDSRQMSLRGGPLVTIDRCPWGGGR